MDANDKTLSYGEISINELKKTLQRIENNQKLIKEEFANQRNRLLRKNRVLDAAKVTIDNEFSTLNTLLEDLDGTSRKYFEDRNKFMAAMSTFVCLQKKMEETNECRDNKEYVHIK